jgi:vacuolar-type H+-ATPase subunit F/Vma7
MKAAVLAEKIHSNGFALGGINKSVEASKDKMHLLSQFNELIQDKEIGLIILSQDVSSKLRKQVIDLVSTSPLPAVIELPGEGDSISLVEEIIQKVMGQKNED